MRALVAISCLVVLGACGRRTDGHDEGHGHAASTAPSASSHEGEHAQLPRVVRLSKEVIADAKIRSAPAVKETVVQALSLPGEIAADPDGLARISSPAAGRIEAVLFKEGSSVKKGDGLIVVRVPEVGKVRSAYRATESRAKAARSNAERLRQLLAQRLAAEQQVIDSEAEADALEAEARSFGEQLGALGAGTAGAFAVTLRAPISGTVVSRDAVVGQPVSPEQTLGSIADLGEMWFLGRAFEKDLGRLRDGAKAEVHLNAYPSEHFEGTVEYVGQRVDPVARTVTARIRLTNRDGLLRIGLFGTGQVAVGSDEKATPRLVVPLAAVTDIAGRRVVFVEHEGGEFELHEVTLGDEALGRAEVLAGLREGERVVVEGVFTVKSIVMKGSFAEDEH